MATAAQVELAEYGGIGTLFELLLACCRTRVDDEIEAMICAEVDWKTLLDLATRHRVLPAVGERISTCGRLSPEARGTARARLANHQRRVLRFSAMLAAILEEFERRQIPVLPFKGPVLSQLLYGDPAAREFGDLDLLIMPHDLPRARVALGRLGYEPKIQLSRRCEREYLRSGYELGFGFEAERNLVELHWQVLPRFYSVPFDVKAIFKRAVDMHFEGRHVRVPCKEDLLLMLCVHAAKHEWSQLGMIRDITALAAFDLDWAWVEAEARRIAVLRIVGISLLLAQTVLNAELPESFADSSDNYGCDAFVADLRRKLRQCELSDIQSLRYFRSMMLLRERWRDRLRIVWRLASTPSIEEWNAAAVPDWLFPLYRGVRAWRLAQRFGRSFRKSQRSKRLSLLN